MSEYDDEEFFIASQRKLITLKEVSKIYSIPLNSLYKWSSQKKIPKYKIGRRVYVKPEQFEEWLESFFLGIY